MRLSLSELSQNSICLNRRRNEQLDQSVYQKRAGVGDFFGVFAGHVQLAGMSIFVPCKPTCVADFLKVVRQFQLQDFVVKAFTFFELNTTLSSNVGSNSFHANTKKCACRSGRRMGDSLSFVEYVFDVFGHVFDCLDSCTRWIHKFAVSPEVKLPAMCAFGYEVDVSGVALEEIISRKMKVVATKRIFVEKFVAFVSVKNRMFFYLADNSAMGATK